jgi:hypothetical protein
MMPRHPLTAFEAAGNADLDAEQKKTLALLLYLTLETLEDIAPRCCEDEPADLMVRVGRAEFCLQDMIADLLEHTFNAPLPGVFPTVGDA